MNIIISGKNIDVTESLRTTVNEKISKLDKYFTSAAEAYVTLSVEKGRQKIEVTIPVKGSVVRSEQVSDDMYVSIDLAMEVIERQLIKYKKKLVEKHREAGVFNNDFFEKDDFEDDGIEIVRVKQVDAKPMYPEDACLEMELTGHNFYVFTNAEDGKVNVVYKRKGNTYGLIEPQN